MFFRRCVYLFAIVGMLAGQVAAVPHAHGGLTSDEQREHDATPHFHRHGAHPRHDHARDGHHHRHFVRPSEGASQQRPLGTNQREHEATAIDCGWQVLAASPAQPQTWSTTKLVTWGTTPQCNPLAPYFLMNENEFIAGRPPDRVLDRSNLYLTLRNLRI